jgi:hypothetical protein
LMDNKNIIGLVQPPAGLIAVDGVYSTLMAFEDELFLLFQSHLHYNPPYLFIQ